jgi:hypothetical protein
MGQIIVGEGAVARELARTVAASENPRIWADSGSEDGDPPGSSAPLARDLTSFEAEALERTPEAIVLADDSDAALAAALVATKLLIPLAATDGARRSSTVNGRLIAQLAGAYTRSP